MKIDFNPQAAAQAQAQSARGPQAPTTPTVPEGSDDGVTITLSQAAQHILKTGDADYDGKSPAHQARQFIANSLATASAEDGEAPNFSGPFGQIVKTFAPGHNKEPEVVEEPDVVPEDGGATGATTETGETAGTTDTGDTGATEGGDTTVAEGSDGSGIAETDPAVVVEEPDITEVLDESAPTDGEPSETGTSVAVSGDAVASTGDGEASDGGTIGDTDAPVTVVDTGDVTDELLDQLDENSEEVV